MPTDFLHWQPSDAMLAKARRLKSDSYMQKHRPKGYAAEPGTGPEKETCKTCAHCHGMWAGKRKIHKCLLRRAGWTASVRTDIILRSPACGRWKAKPAPTDETKPQ